MISRKKAWTHFQETILPRRTVDCSEGLDGRSNESPRFRRVGPDEEDRGELYSLCHDGINTFGHFGIGIGIYFAQLAILAVVFFVSGFIMLSAGMAYTGDFGISEPTVALSATCGEVNVTAIHNCPNGAAECELVFRPNCELPYQAGAADLAMCFLLAVTILASKFMESRIEVKLDESIQTVQDYSIEVMDPDKDADDPDEWHRFFSQFGQVSYVTIVRRNSVLTELLLKKHTYGLKLKEAGVFGSSIAQKREAYSEKYHAVSQQVNAAMMVTYPVCRVYVTFEHEAGQRKCVEELEVPDLQAALDTNYKDNVLPEHRFRGCNVLNVREPCEPDNIIWKHLEVTNNAVWVMKAVSALLSVSVFVVIWYIEIAASVNSTLLAVVIGVLDSVLPYVVAFVTDLLSPQTEGGRQSGLQMRLFFARLLLSTLIPYIQSQWADALSDEFITRVFTVQVSACFAAPLFALVDLQGLFNRHVLAYFAETQAELDACFNGTEWSLAEKYTGIARVLFVSLFYSLLTPLSILLCAVAFVVIFLIDNFLLLRKWHPPTMLDAKIAVRLRQQAVLAVAAHMYVTLRYIYSWPMDEVQPLSGGTYGFADKNPPLSPLRMREQHWHSASQTSLLRAYRICWVVVSLVALYMWIIEPTFKFVKRMLCYNIKPGGKSGHAPFSALPSASTYFPLLTRGERSYMCSYTKDVLFRHRPVVREAFSVEKDDLSTYVPIHLQPRLLSVIKFFGRDPLSYLLSDEEAGQLSKQVQAVATISGAPSPPKALLQRMQDSLYGVYHDNLLQPLAYHYERVARRQKEGELARSGSRQVAVDLGPLGRADAHTNVVRTDAHQLALNSDLSEHYERAVGRSGVSLHLQTQRSAGDGLDEQVPLIVRVKPVDGQTRGLGGQVLAGPDSPPKLSHSASGGQVRASLIIDNLRIATNASARPLKVSDSPAPSLKTYAASHSDHVTKGGDDCADGPMDAVAPLSPVGTPAMQSAGLHGRSLSEHVVKMPHNRLPHTTSASGLGPQVLIHSHPDTPQVHIDTAALVESTPPCTPSARPDDLVAESRSDHPVKLRAFDQSADSMTGHLAKHGSMVVIDESPLLESSPAPHRRPSVHAQEAHIDTAVPRSTGDDGIVNEDPADAAEPYNASYSDHPLKA